MESHRYKKPKGVPSLLAAGNRGLAASVAVTGSDSTTDETTLCRHINARGHRCRMLRANEAEFCAHHARRIKSLDEAQTEAIASELLDSIEDFTTAGSVNQFLGNVTKQLARKRIQRRDAIALAYLSQLLLNSLSAMQREDAIEEEERNQQEQQPRTIVWDIVAEGEGADVPRGAPRAIDLSAPAT